MSIFTGKPAQASSGTFVPGRVIPIYMPPAENIGSIGLRRFFVEKFIDFKFEIKQS